MNLLKAIVLSPGEIFTNSREKSKEIVSLFTISFIIVLLKSFFKARHEASNFFETQILNEIIYFLSIPQIAAIAIYLFFFIFSLLLFLVIRIFSKDASLKSLMLSLMSISGVGIFAHIATMPLMFFAKSLINPIGYIFYLWVIVLTLWAIKNSQNLPLVKVIPSFLVVAFPFLLFGWLPVISPYLVFLAV